MLACALTRASHGWFLQFPFYGALEQECRIFIFTWRFWLLLVPETLYATAGNRRECSCQCFHVHAQLWTTEVPTCHTCRRKMGIPCAAPAQSYLSLGIQTARSSSCLFTLGRKVGILHLLGDLYGTECYKNRTRQYQILVFFTRQRSSSSAKTRS